MWNEKIKNKKEKKNISPPRSFKFIASYRLFRLAVVYLKIDMLDNKNSTAGLENHAMI